MTVLALSYALQTSLNIRPALALTEEQILMTGQSGEGLLFSLFAFSPPTPPHPPPPQKRLILRLLQTDSQGLPSSIFP